MRYRRLNFSITTLVAKQNTDRPVCRRICAREKASDAACLITRRRRRDPPYRVPTVLSESRCCMRCVFRLYREDGRGSGGATHAKNRFRWNSIPALVAIIPCARLKRRRNYAVQWPDIGVHGRGASYFLCISPTRTGSALIAGSAIITVRFIR